MKIYNSKTFRFRSVIYIVFISGLFSLPLNANAFKVKTHVWVAQQVINDLQDDGALSFVKNNKEVVTIKVDPEIVQAILNNPSIYRMGNIGPDAFPDVYTGQFSVHPGLPDPAILDGWQSDDWLRFLMASKRTVLKSPKTEKAEDIEFLCQVDANSECKNPTLVLDKDGNSYMTEEQRAFVYGYAGHFASDTFAHTYVNQYSGDRFIILEELKAGLTFNNAFVEEARHIEMEKYIDIHLPPIKDNNGFILDPLKSVKTPTIFLRNRLVFNDVVADRNELSGAKHLTAVHKLRKALVGADEDKFQKVDIAVMKYLFEYYTGYSISDDQAETYVRRVKKWNQWANEYNGVEEAQEAMNAFFDGLQDTITITAEFRQRMNQSIIDVFEKEGVLAQEVARLEEKKDELLRFVCNCKKYLPNYPSCKTNCALSKVVIENAIGALNASINIIKEDLKKLNEKHEGIVAELETIVSEGLYATLAQFNMITETFQAITADMNIIRGIRDNWVRDLELGIDDYIETSTKIGIEFMKPKNGDPLKHLSDWSCRWMFPMTTGLYSQVTVGLCDTTDHLSNMANAFDGLISKLLGLAPGYNDIQKKFAEFEEEVNLYAEDMAIQFGQKILGDEVDIKQVMQAITATTDDTELNKIFETDHSTNGYKGLLEFPDMATRMKIEMGIDPAILTIEPLKPDEFLPLKNAVTLSKLALLKAKQLNLLADLRDPNNPNDLTKYKPLYDESTSEPVNILIGAIRNIDGNQQWMSIAPPYPRRNNYEDEVWKDTIGREELRKFGYGSEDSKGLLLWRDCEARPLFRELFSGPMAPTLIEDMQLNNQYLENYPISDTNPFPDGNWNFDNCEPPPGVDLQVLTFNSPTTASIGQINVLVSGVIKNAGDANAVGYVNIHFFLSSDATLDSADIRLSGASSIGGLAAGSSAPFDVTLRIPNNTLAGDYYLLSVVDYYNRIIEIDDPDNLNGNNLAVGQRVKISLTTDIAMTALSGPEIASIGERISITGTVANLDPIAPAQGYSGVSFYLSKDSIYDSTDIKLSSGFPVRYLNPSQALDFKVVVQIPNNTKAGGYRLLAIADFYSRISEIDDPDNKNGNNLFLGPVVDVKLTTDIATTGLSGPTTAAVGQSISVSGTVTNLDSIAPVQGYSGIFFYLSKDSIYDTSDLKIGAYSFSFLSPGQALNFTSNMTLRTNIPAGNYNILGIANYYNSILEIDSPDNRNGNNLSVGNVINVTVP